MGPNVRKLALAIHLVASLGWIGAVLAYLAVGLAGSFAREAEAARGAWMGLELIGWWVIVPLAVAALLSGVLMALATTWGLFDHYWVVVSLVLTIVAAVVLAVHMRDVSRLAAMSRDADAETLAALGGDLLHPTAGLAVLIAVTLLNVYKPRGLTRRGWRKQQERASRA